ncbi:MAG: extracellular solute-binding protein [Clostridia bacterium]
MNQKIRTLVSLLLVIATILSLGACVKTTPNATSGENLASETTTDGKAPVKNGEKQKVSVLCPGDEAKTRSLMVPLIEKFQSENPDMKVEIIYKGWGDWIATYASMFQAGTQPDVIMWWGKSLKDEYVAGKFVPLNDYVDPAVVAEIPKNMLDAVTVDGNQYLLPVDSSGFLLYYRRDIFEQAGLDPNSPPKTWDELLHACEQIAAKTEVYPLALPGKCGTEALHELIATFISQSTGQPMLDENNRICFNNAEGLAALDFVMKLMPYADPKSTEYARGDTRQLFIDGKAAMTLGDGVWAVPGLQKTFGNNLNETVAGIAPPPAGPAGKYNVVGVNGWVIAQKDNAEAAGRLIKFLYSPEALFAYHSIYGSTPYLQYEFDQETFSYDFWKVAQEATFEYNGVLGIGKYHPVGSGIYAPLEPIWSEMIMGSISTEEALQKIVKEIDGINGRYGIE